MPNITVVGSTVRTVRAVDEIPAVAGEALAAGASVRYDPATGRVVNGNGTTTAEAKIIGLVTRAAVEYQPVTVIRQGVMDGFNLDAYAIGGDVYASDTDGVLSTEAGIVSVKLGYVDAAFASEEGSAGAADKLLYIRPRRPGA